jgi:hypothetical protein
MPATNAGPGAQPRHRAPSPLCKSDAYQSFYFAPFRPCKSVAQRRHARSNIRPTLLPLSKYLLDILPPIQHAHNLKDIVHDSVEDDVRARGKRPKSRAQFMSRPPCKRMIFDCSHHLTDFVKNCLLPCSCRRFRSTFKKAFFNVLRPHRTSVGRKESKCVFKMRRSCSSRDTRAQYAAPRPLLQRLSPTLCTPILRFTDTSVTGAGRSNPWLCFARRHFNQ